MEEQVEKKEIVVLTLENLSIKCMWLALLKHNICKLKELESRLRSIQGYTCFWNNYSTAIFKTFLKGPCYHDNLITQWLPKGAFGLVTRKFIWGFCSSDWWLECLKSVLSSEIPLTVPWGPAGRGPAGWWMRIYKQQTLPSGVSTLISPTRSIHEASTT